MMAKTKSKYQTDFKTYEEFEQIFNSIPRKNRLEWAKNLDPELLRMKTDYGWTVAHVLADRGTLPEKFVTDELLRMKDNDGWTVAYELADRGTLPEKFVTDELLRMKKNDGRTVAHVLAYCGTLPEKFVTDELLRMKTDYGWTVAKNFYNSLSKGSRWDLLTPVVLNAPYDNSDPLVVTKLVKDLSGMSDAKLEEALSVMPHETRLKLFSDITNPVLLERIRKCLDRETEKEALETSPDGDDTDLHSEERESLYCGVRSDR